MTDTYREAARSRLGGSSDASSASAGVPSAGCGAGPFAEQPVAQIASELGISESCLRRWMDVADVDDGRRPGLTTDEKAELVALRRKTRVLELEVEILKRAAAYFAKENVLPK